MITDDVLAMMRKFSRNEAYEVCKVVLIIFTIEFSRSLRSIALYPNILKQVFEVNKPIC